MTTIVAATEVARGPGDSAVHRRVPAVVLGGSGYVAGELLRLIAAHPVLALAGVTSESRGGTRVDETFPHLAGCLGEARFSDRDELPRLLDEARGGARVSDHPGGSPVADDAPLAVFCAAPHGAAAPLLDAVLAAGERAGARLLVVDLSADFRFPDAAAYEAVYRHPHGAPGRLAEFVCGLPEHRAGAPADRVAHPGCFTTAFLLATVPLLAAGLADRHLHACGITGSTGAGRTPTATTHHPARRSTVFAYQPLAHRHAAEMRLLAANAVATGAAPAAAGAPPTVAPAVHFVPHAGPFARGIHLTVQARLARAADAGEVLAALRTAYAGAPFVDVLDAPPRLQDVVASNRCRLFATADDDTLAVTAVIDNLVKGAAGGGVQWMNRMLNLPETTGLLAAGPGWL